MKHFLTGVVLRSTVMKIWHHTITVCVLCRCSCIFFERMVACIPPLPQITLFCNGEGIVLLLGSSVSVNVSVNMKRNLPTCRNRSVTQIMFVISKSRQSQGFCQKMLVVLHIMTFCPPRPLHKCTYNII